jgi:hypothetical protein
VENQYSITWVQIADQIFLVKVQAQLETSLSLQLLSLQDNGLNILALL